MFIHFSAFSRKLQAPWEQKPCLVSVSHQMLNTCGVKKGAGVYFFFFFLADQIYLGSQTFLMAKGRPEEASTSV